MTWPEVWEGAEVNDCGYGGATGESKLGFGNDRRADRMLLTSQNDDNSYDEVDPSSVEMIDLFAGPGGLDVAARWISIRSVGIEADNEACRTRLAAGLGTRHADVRDRAILHEFPNATILAGGPPCQTYSVAGSGSGRRALTHVLRFVDRIAEGDISRIDDELRQLSDERTGLILQPLLWAVRAMDMRRPFSTIVLEQVPTVIPVWQAFGGVLMDRGYGVKIGLVHTERFGVPQTRRRAILIACHGRSAHLPIETHRRYGRRFNRKDGPSHLKEWETMANALPHRSEGFEVVSNYGTGGNPKLRGRRTSNEPAATVTGKVRRNRILANGIEQDRLRPGEAGRLQTFPLDYPWMGNDQYQQIGNAIAPRLGVHILAAAVFGARPVENELDKFVNASWAETRRGYGSISLLPIETQIDQSRVGEQLALFET
ncbi:DNA cytosine methyltransferase [Nocardia tengchongensis]